MLAGLKTVLHMGRTKGENPLPENQSVPVGNIVNLRAGLQTHQIRESDFS